MTATDRFPTFRAAGRFAAANARIAPSLAWRWFRWPLVGLVLVLLLAHTVLNAVAGRRLERDLQAVRDRGEPLTLHEVAPPPVPDAENAALVYERAFALMRPLGQAGPGDHDGALISGFLNPPRDVKAMSDKGTGHRKLPPMIAFHKRPISPAQVRPVIARYAPALALLRQAAAMPRCRFPVSWESGAGAKFPHLRHLLMAGQLLAAAAILESMDGRSNRALEDCGAISSMSRQILIEPELISQLVGYALLANGRATLNRVLGTARPDPRTCERLSQALAGFDLITPFGRAIEGERCWGLWVFDAARRNPRSVLPFWEESYNSSGTNHQPPIAVWIAQHFWPLWGPFLKLDEAYYLESEVKPVEDARAGLRVQEHAEFPPPAYAIISSIVLPVYAQAAVKRDEARAGLGLDEWGLALCVYHETTGRYPDSLAQVRATPGWRLPSDPFGGKEFRYRREGPGYLLYSVGPNEHDDRGYGRFTGLSPAKDSDDDIAWEVK